jgi:hypothetical protein
MMLRSQSQRVTRYRGVADRWGVWAALVNPHTNIEGVRMLAVATN